MKEIDFKAHTETTITSPTRLIKEIERVRARGWAASNQEFMPGGVGCAVSVYTADKMFVAGLGVSVPAAQCPFGDIDRFIPDLLACAEAIGADLRGDSDTR